MDLSPAVQRSNPAASTFRALRHRPHPCAAPDAALRQAFAYKGLHTAGMSQVHYLGRSKKTKITSLDIAHRAGVSQATVSRVLRGSPLVNAETRRRVEDAV